MLNRQNKSCVYFPCHNDLEDCTFCYCPFYPCNDGGLGERILAQSKKSVWSCKDCSWIHNKKRVDKIFGIIRNSGFKKMRYNLKPKIKNTAVIILGHGSKRKTANQSLHVLTRQIRNKRIFKAVEPAFLQLCRPGLSEVIKKIVDSGYKKIVILPFFLFSGKHVTSDIPERIARESRKHGGVEFIYAKNIGHNPRINEIAIDTILESIE